MFRNPVFMTAVVVVWGMADTPSLAMFTAGGDENPSTRLKVVWGVILGALGLVMIITDSVGCRAGHHRPQCQPVRFHHYPHDGVPVRGP